MNKVYGITANGEIDELIDELSKLNEVQIGRLHDYVSIEVSEAGKEIFTEVEAIVKRQSAAHCFSYGYSFQAYDITRDDFGSADALEAAFPLFGEKGYADNKPKKLIIENEGIIEINKCCRCKEEQIKWVGEGKFILSAEKNFSFPAFRTPFHCPVIREDLFYRLTEKGMLRKVFFSKCDIRTRNTIKDDYYVILPEVDLGIPIGDIKYSEACVCCHKIQIDASREFLFCYDKNKFNDIDIAWTSWLPFGSIFIKTSVYNEFIKFPELNESQEEIFKPVTIR